MPIVLEKEDCAALGTDWAQGFMQGVALRADSWQVLIEDEDYADSTQFERKPRRKLSAAKQLEKKLEMLAVSIKVICDFFAPVRAPLAPAKADLKLAAAMRGAA